MLRYEVYKTIIIFFILTENIKIKLNIKIKYVYVNVTSQAKYEIVSGVNFKQNKTILRHHNINLNLEFLI